jgi:Tfp pilus assembly protein PilV
MTSAVLQLRTIIGTRAHAQGGFGMIELLTAMTVMLIGLFAVFAVFEAGIVQIRRASTITTAAAVADSEMEKFRAIRYDSLGLTNTAVDAVVAGSYGSTYTSQSAYKSDTAVSTTLAASMDASQLTMSVTGHAGFPTSSPYIVKVDNELILVSGGANTNSWTVRIGTERGYQGTTATTHSAGATVYWIQRVNVPTCGTAPCTTSVPTKTVTGADGRAYRVDTYMTWKQVSNSAGTASTGRLLKFVTIVVRANASPYRVWARLSSSFDESTGV